MRAKGIYLLLLLGLINTSSSPTFYNILSLDGAGMNGIKIAKILSLIEQNAYEYAEKHNFADKVPKYTNHKIIPIKDLFDMIAATSVTSFLAVGLSIPSTENTNLPAYTAENLLRLY